jgi:hypothetical protein
MALAVLLGTKNIFIRKETPVFNKIMKIKGQAQRFQEQFTN